MKTYNLINGYVGLVFITAALIAVTPASAATTGETMLYLVEFEATESGAPNGREQIIELLDSSVVPSLEKLATDGRIRALSAWGVWNWKVTPLESFAYRADVEKKVIKALRAQQCVM